MYVNGLPCFVCNEPTSPSQQLFTTQGDWLPQGDPLGHACGAFAHWDCYDPWPHRPRFARSYFEFQVAQERTAPSWDRAYLDDSVLVIVNANPSVAAVAVVLAETGSRLEMKLFAWEDWLRTPEASATHRCEKRALAAVKPVLRIAVPTPESLLVAVDPTRKASRRREELAHEAGDLAAEGPPPGDRMAFLRWLADIRQDGVACPHCGLSFTEYRAVARRRQRVSMVCPRCGKKMWREGGGR